jgi:hypothetical protein
MRQRENCRLYCSLNEVGGTQEIDSLISVLSALQDRLNVVIGISREPRRNCYVL